jgi:hypothetical protein
MLTVRKRYNSVYNLRLWGWQPNRQPPLGTRNLLRTDTINLPPKRLWTWRFYLHVADYKYGDRTNVWIYILHIDLTSTGFTFAWPCIIRVGKDTTNWMSCSAGMRAVCIQLASQLYTNTASTTRQSPYPVLNNSGSPDDGHNDARNMLRLWYIPTMHISIQ